MSKYDLSDNQWKAVKDEIAAKTSRSGQPRRDPRELINAINWVARTGSPWCELPEEYGPWHTAYNNFRKWTEDGTIGRIFAKISPKSEETDEIQLDGTYVKAHQHSSGVKKSSKFVGKPGQNRPRLMVELPEAVEGLPRKFTLSPTETANR